MKRLRYEDGPIDPVDRKLLAALIDNARISTAELARTVGLSAPSVAERIRRLEEAGVIEGYTVRINPEALGLPISAWLRIRPVPGALARSPKYFRACRRSSSATALLVKTVFWRAPTCRRSRIWKR